MKEGIIRKKTSADCFEEDTTNRKLALDQRVIKVLKISSWDQISWTALVQAKVRLKIMGNVYPNKTSVSPVLPGP